MIASGRKISTIEYTNKDSGKQEGNKMTFGEMVKKGLLVEDGPDYITDDGRRILRVYVGRRGTLRWRVEGKEFNHRSLFEAYYELER